MNLKSLIPRWTPGLIASRLFCLWYGIGAATAQAPPASSPGSTQPPRVTEIRLDGIVHPVSADFIIGGMQEAIDRGDALILLQIDTPGGLDDSMRRIIEKIIQSPVPVAVFVAPSGSRAASAGYFILLSADIAAMAPGTNSGSAHPVLIGGQMDEVMNQKVENDAAAYLRSIAGKRGRNVELAETGVTESKSFTEEEALKGNLIDLIAANREELLAKLDGYTVTRFDGTEQTLRLAGAQVLVYDPSFRQRFLSRILDPNVAFILLILGVLGLYVEFSNPGLILPGVAGGIAIILALFAFSLLPVNWAGAALIFLAIAFFVLEANFATGGILAAGGVLSMVLGALMLINTRLPGGTIALTTALAVAIPFAVISVLLMRLVLQAHRAKVATGTAGMMGAVGRAQTAVAPHGKVFVHGELWDAHSATPIPAGASIRVISLDEMTLEVEPASPAGAGLAPSNSQPASKGV